MARDDAAEPLRRTHILVGDEYLKTPGEADDPLGEDGHTRRAGARAPLSRPRAVPHHGLLLDLLPLLHALAHGRRSGRRVLFLSRPQWEKALDYIDAHPEIRDVLLSGGDPLSLADDKLDYLLGRLRTIKHVEFVRIGTKIPVVLPMRVTRDAREGAQEASSAVDERPLHPSRPS